MFLEELKHFCNETSIHGLGQIANGGIHFLKRLIWFGIFVGCLAYAGQQLYSTIKGKLTFIYLFCFELTWHTSDKTGFLSKLGQSPICHYLSSIANLGYFRQFLTRLVQNLTLRHDCNLIPSAHRTQHMSSQSDHWTISLISLHGCLLFKGLI